MTAIFGFNFDIHTGGLLMITKLPIGLQLYSVRDFLEKNFYGTLKKVKEMGYDAVEFAGGFYGHTAEEIKEMCEDLGLDPISAHVGRGVIMADVEKVISDYREVGCRYIAIPWADRNKELPGADGYEDFKKDLRTISAECKKYSIPLLYHNHDFEFVKIDGKNKLDILYSDLPADVLQTEIDTCWARVGGENPSEFILKYSGRAPLVHIKDYVGERSANMYALIDGGKVEKTEETKPAVPFELRPVGSGVQDVASIIKASEKAGAVAVIVEQDNPSMGLNSLECAKKSIDYIKSL